MCSKNQLLFPIGAILFVFLSQNFERVQSKILSPIENVQKSEIIDLITLKKFIEADKKLDEIAKTSSNNLEVIINDIVTSFDSKHIILEYANQSSDPLKAYYMLKKLYSTYLSSLDNLLIMFKILKTAVIEKEYSNNDLKLNARNFLENTLQPQIETKAVDQLKKHLLVTQSVMNDGDLESFINTLFELDEQMFYNINQNAINQIHGNIDKTLLHFNTFRTETYKFPLNALLLLQLTSKDSKFVPDDSDLFLFFKLIVDGMKNNKKVQKMSNFTHQKFNELFEKFPTIKNLLLPNKICFKNLVTKDYMCPISSNGELRLGLCNKIELNNSWTLISDKGSTTFKIAHFNDRYHIYKRSSKIYIGSSHGFDFWTFDIQGKGLYILDNHENVVCADEAQTISGSRFVSLLNTREDRCLWIPEGC